MKIKFKKIEKGILTGIKNYNKNFPKILFKRWGKLEVLKIILAIITAYFYSYLGMAAFRYLIKAMFNKYFLKFQIFLIAFFYLIAFFIVSFYVIKILTFSIVIDKDKRKHLNNYFILAISGIVIVVLLGFSLIRDTYSSKFPLEIYILENNYTYSTNIECNSWRSLDILVKGDTLRCQFVLNSKDKLFFDSISEPLFRYYYSNPSINITILEKIKPSYSFGNNTLKVDDISIPLKEEGLIEFRIIFGFVHNNSTSVNYSSYYINEFVASEKNYFERQKEKITLLFLLVSAGVFSVLAGVRNLKDIMNSKR